MKLNIFSFLTLLTIHYPSPTFSHLNTPSPLPLPSKQIHQFPFPTFIENIAIRQNGHLLLNLLTTPDLYTLNPLLPSQAPTLLHTFPHVTSLLGITEVLPDVFVVLAGNFTLATATSIPGTYSAWTVDFTKSKLWSSGPKISKIVDIKEAHLPNGMTTLSSQPGSVLFADSVLGCVWRLNIFTKTYTRIITSLPEMAPVGAPSIGINGLRLYRGYLYWTNTNQAALFRARITASGSLAGSGKVELLAIDPLAMDDFTIEEDSGVVWVCSNFGNDVFAVQKNGGLWERKTVVGSLGELTVAGDSAAAFGRGRTDRDILYVVTAGALGSPVNGTITEGGKVVAVDTSGFRF